MHFGHLHQRTAPAPSGHGRERHGYACPTQDLDGIRSEDLQVAALGKVGQTLGQEHQTFARQPQPG